MLRLWLPAAAFERLPAHLKQGEAVRCVVALFSQGINAQQTVANAMGEAGLQEYINHESMRTLRSYCASYTQLRRAEVDDGSSSADVDHCARELAELHALLEHAEETVARSHSEKNTEIIR